MKFGFWNVKGIQKRNLDESMKLFCKIYFIKVMVFVEIIINVQFNINIIYKFGFSKFDFIRCFGYFRGIWLMWNDI